MPESRNQNGARKSPINGSRMLIETIPIGGFEAYDEADELTGLQEALDAIQVSGSELGEFIRNSAETILAPLKGIGLDEISIEFSVGVEGKMGLPFIAKATGSGSIKVTAKWTHHNS